MKKSLFALAAVAAFACVNFAGVATAAPVALSPSVAASHNAITAVKSHKKAHKASAHKSKKSSHKKAAKPA